MTVGHVYFLILFCTAQHRERIQVEMPMCWRAEYRFFFFICFFDILELAASLTMHEPALCVFILENGPG